nr:hypothetical protein [Tanacetum cinerariifolium]
MDDPNITIKEYIRLEEEKARKREKVFNWETATYSKIWDDEDVHDLRYVETEFPAIVFNDALTSEVALLYEPTVSPLNDNQIDFRISFGESDNEDYSVIYDKNSFSYKIISVNDLKMDSENDNGKVNMHSFPSPEPTVSYFDDLDFFKDFESEFPAIVYNDALTSKSNFLTEPTLSPQHIDEFNPNDETSFSGCDDKEQNVLYFNDLFPFNVIYPDDSKSDKDNDDNKIDIKQSSRGNVINSDDAYSTSNIDAAYRVYRIRRIVFREPSYPFDYPMRRLTMEEILAKFIDEGRREHEEMKIFIKEFKTINEHLLKTRSNLLSELKIKSLLTNKFGLGEACTETLNERCSAVLLNELPSKEKDPRSFTTPCQVYEKPKEAEDLAADHLSRFQKPHMEVLTEREIADKFSDKHLMVLKSKSNNDEPCETLEILAHCHSGPTGGHHSVNVTAKKVYESGFYWASVFKDANEYVRRCDACQRSKNISSRNEMPQNNIQLEKALQRYDVTRKLSTAYHPQSNRQAEVTNKAIKRVRERSVGYNPKGWSKKLNDALWAFRTAYKTLTGCTPFRLVYGKACHLPVEIEHKLNELAQLRDDAYENTRIYKEWTKKWHDSRFRGDKDFKVGDKVLLYNSRLNMYPGKLKLKWSGPNIVKTVYPHGAIEITDKDWVSFKVNVQRLKKYYEGNIDKEDDEVIEFENGVTLSIRRIDYLDVIQSLFFSAVNTACSLNEYSVFDTGFNTAYHGV